MRERAGRGASRREFLQGAAGAALAAGPAAAREGSAATPADATAPGAFLSEREQGVLAELADHVLPGAGGAGAVDYIEGLLTAFDHDPPRIYAGGPFSGRHPSPSDGATGERRPENDFARFLPLNRVQERAWRLRLFGSDGQPVAAAGGPVPGLRHVIRDGARRALALSDQEQDTPAAVWDDLPEAFRRELTALVVEGSLGDPVYGGNRFRRIWKRIHFEGDSLPLGYALYDERSGGYRERSDAPVSRLDPGPDAHPLGFWTKLLLWILSFVSRRTELL